MKNLIMQRFGIILMLLLIGLSLCISDFYFPTLGWDSEILILTGEKL